MKVTWTYYLKEEGRTIDLEVIYVPALDKHTLKGGGFRTMDNVAIVNRSTFHIFSHGELSERQAAYRHLVLLCKSGGLRIGDDLISIPEVIQAENSNRLPGEDPQAGIQSQLATLGFLPNERLICGLRPHFRRGDDILFLIGANYWIRKIAMIGICVAAYPHEVFGVLMPGAPDNAAKDWVTDPKMKLLQPDPPAIGRWSNDGNSIIYQPYTFN
ncbi:hypothetical protein [Arsenicibacter rosenii]|uniref:Uncharacterized protein n=1 Tax=Arsenicibacter rosenii TaxID=1750698 RepID=A0A1S2VM10_9BACT|nr:hypothetical protein [Arsenicibacter rosenii]OIN59793.1 hypothetical protein BLX24_08015 [Arsenicibacter rosenii]